MGKKVIVRISLRMSKIMRTPEKVDVRTYATFVEPCVSLKKLIFVDKNSSKSCAYLIVFGYEKEISNYIVVM